MAGRLDGSIDGRPIRLVAENRDIVLSAGKFSSLFALRRSGQGMVEPLRAALKFVDIRLLVRVKWFGKVELFPRPSFLARLILPRV